MSQRNWETMVEKGIAGEDTVTCFVAALDCLFDNVDIPYKTYARYTEAYLEQKQFGDSSRRSRRVYREVLFNALGSSCLKNFIARRASNLESWLIILDNALQSKRKIIVNVSYSHVVGLQLVSDGVWRMVGNSLPYDDELTSEEVFEYLYIPPRTEKPDDQKNVFLV